MARDKKPLRICPLQKCLLQADDNYCPWHGVELEPLIGQTINGFIVEEPLSGGGYAVVYRAIAVANPEFVVAMKILRPPYCYQQPRVEDFLNEAVATQGIPPPNVPPIFGVMGTPWPHLTMELVRGSTLEAYLIARSASPGTTTDAMQEPTRPRSLPRFLKLRPPPIVPLGECIDYLIGIARPMAEAHRLGRVHRDLKPANIMISEDAKTVRPEDQVKVIDWGIALVLANTQSGAVDPDSTLVERKTARYQIAGTLPYMAPEAFDGRYSPQTDVYAFGVTAFELLSGQRPHDPPLSAPPGFDTVSAWKNVHQNSEPKRLSDHRRAPKRLRRLVRKCLEKVPEARPPDGKSLLQELLAIRRARDWRVTLRRTLGTAAAVLIVLLTVLLIRDTFFAKLESLPAFAAAMNLGYSQGSSFYASKEQELVRPQVLPRDFESLTFTISADDGAPPDASPRLITDLSGFLSDWYKRCKEREEKAPGSAEAFVCRVLLEGDILPKRIHHELEFVYDLSPPELTRIAINSQQLVLSDDSPHYFQLTSGADGAYGFDISFNTRDNVPLLGTALISTNASPVQLPSPLDTLQNPGRTVLRQDRMRIPLPPDAFPPLRLRMTNLAGLRAQSPRLYPVPRPDQIRVVGEPRINPDALVLTLSVPRQFSTREGWDLKYAYSQDDSPEPAPPLANLQHNGNDDWIAAEAPAVTDKHVWVYVSLEAPGLESGFIPVVPLPKVYEPDEAADFDFTLETWGGRREFSRSSKNRLVCTNARPLGLVTTLKNNVEEKLRSFNLGQDQVTKQSTVSRDIKADFDSDEAATRDYTFKYTTLRGKDGEIRLSVCFDQKYLALDPFRVNNIAREGEQDIVLVRPAEKYSLEVEPRLGQCQLLDGAKLTLSCPQLPNSFPLVRGTTGWSWSVEIDAADLRMERPPCGTCASICGYVDLSVQVSDAAGNNAETRLACGIFDGVDTSLLDEQRRSIPDGGIIQMPTGEAGFSICNPIGFRDEPRVDFEPMSAERAIRPLTPATRGAPKYEFQYEDRSRLPRQVRVTIHGTLLNGDEVNRVVIIRPSPPELVPDFMGLAWSRLELLDGPGRKECVYVSTSEVSWKALGLLLDEGKPRLAPAVYDRVRAMCDAQGQVDLPASGVKPEDALEIARAAGCDLPGRDEIRRILREQEAQERGGGGAAFCKTLLERENVNAPTNALRTVADQRSDRQYFHGLVDFVGNALEFVRPDGGVAVYGAQAGACVRCESSPEGCYFVVRVDPLRLDVFDPREWKGRPEGVSFRLVIRAGTGKCREFEELVNCVPQ